MFARIKTRILAALVAMVTLSVLAAGLVTMVLVRDVVTRQRKANLRLMAHHVEAEMQNMLEVASKEFRELSSGEEIEVFAHKSQYQVLLKLFSEQGRPFSSIAFINPQGREELRLENGMLAKPKTWDLADPLLAEAAAHPGHEVVRALVGQDGLFLRFLSARKTYFDEFLGDIVADFPLADVDKLLAATAVGEQGFALVADQDGRILASPREGLPAALALDALEDGTLRSALRDGVTGLGPLALAGREYVAATVPLEGQPWSVAVLLPQEEFFKEVVGLQASLLLVFLALTVVAGWLASRVAGRIAAPLAAVSAAARKVSEGGGLEQVPAQGTGEEADLARSFNVMVDNQHQAMEQLKEARRQAESASQAKGEFLARMSHEIRTPLNAIIGLTDIVLQNSLEDEQRDCLETVGESAQHLLGIVNDVLDFSKIEARKLELHPVHFDLRQSLAATMRALEAQALCKDLDLSLEVASEVPRLLLGDSARLRQVLVNLVGNAIKFTKKGGIRVSVGVMEPLPGAGDAGAIILRFAVEDSGIGVPPEDQARLFDAFAQGSGARANGIRGTGLGLAICKQLVGMMGGEIELLSEAGRGSVFYFTVRFGPGDPSQVIDSRHGEDMAPAVKPLRVLVAEDNPLNARMVGLQLARLGHVAEFAADGRAAVAMLAASDFDLVLMDIEMPGMDGVAATECIRRGDTGKAKRGVPIIALTAHAFVEQREACLQAGMNDFIAKPVNIRQLREVIGRVAGA
jgi:signal transduction histidine kinase/ActR/RegA family two-component response regulator